MRVALFTMVALGILAGGAQGQSAPRAQASRPAPDFLFDRPTGSVGIRGSWVFARAGSDWFDFVTEHLTLENNDFNAPAIGGEVGITLTPRFDLVFGADYSRSEMPSEYRDFVDNLRLPIEQRTRVRELNLSGGLRVALAERGREVGSFAWVPRTVVPYVGAGGGMLWFDVRQSGDFVDFADSSIFTDVFAARGWTPSGHLFAGVDIRVFRRLFLSIDGRYLWAAGDLGSTWINFDPIDLTGARLAAGINVVF